MMNIDWLPLRHLLQKVYSNLGLSHHFVSDCNYLKTAFDFTEALWHRQVDRMSAVKIVMLSEAPLFGAKQTYIYNPESPPTAFFYFNDLRALGNDAVNEKSFHRKQARKAYIIEKMAVKGFLVLDLFPYAFNPEETAINYRRMNKSLYFRLLADSATHYLIPKVKLVLDKSKKVPIFVYRYKKLFEKTNHLVESMFVKHGIAFDGLKMESIHGENMSLDRKKLSQIYRQHAEDRD